MIEPRRVAARHLGVVVMLAWITGVGVAACGGGDPAAPTDGGGLDVAADGAGPPPGDGPAPGCPATPPAAPGGLDPVCEQWRCTPVAAPECWSCAAAPVDGLVECEPAAGAYGACVDGACAAIPDPGVATGATGTTAAHDLDVGGETIPLTLYLPPTDTPTPVVVFLHGFQLAPSLYASYGEHLASWGYVVVMPQMPGGLIGGPTHKDLAAYLEGILDWIVADAANASGKLAGKADATRIALAGHSMGGKISMLVASSDARPRAVFGIDPVDAAGGLSSDPVEYPSVTPELMGSIDVPLVLLGETTNATCSGLFCQACAPEADNFHQYFTNATSPALEVEVKGAFHMSFLDNPSCGLTCSVCPAGTDDTAVTRQLTRRTMTAFFNVILADAPEYEVYLTGAAMADAVSAGRVATAVRNGF